MLTDVNDDTRARPSDLGEAAVHTTSGRVRPLGSSGVVITGGLLGAWQERNRNRTVPHTLHQLEAAGNLDNLRAIAHGTGAAFRGRYPFLDTDIYKALEGIAYELTRPDASPSTRDFFDEAVSLIESAQAEDGYLNSFYQHPASVQKPWDDLSWGHELYNLGHLIQAAVAASRQLGDRRLLRVAERFADLAVSKFGPEGEAQVCGHPEVEMSLVELFRETGAERYLTLAQLFIDRRGRGTVTLRVFSAEYFQDNIPLRDLPSVTGHAVRMAYLATGAADVAIETGDSGLLAALERLFDDMVASKLYVTGGLGSRHSDEAIGDRYELPSERSYSETCAAIGTMQWAWRLFVATGRARYLDVFETVLFNAYAAGLSADGCAFFYDNPLQRREDHQQRTGAEPDGELLRRAWFVCPCCPPNIIRWNAQLQDHLVAAGDDALYLAQYADADITHDGLTLRVRTEYPWDGHISVDVESAVGGTRALALRIPAWCHSAGLAVNGQREETEIDDGWLRVTVASGDRIDLTLAMPVRAHGAHPHLDATRGAVSFARGPIVYCAEQQDNAHNIDDLLVEPSSAAHAALTRSRLTPDAPADAVTITLDATVAPTPAPVLYPELSTDGPALPDDRTPASATLVPYFLWGNREAQAMRVWLRRL